MAFKAPARSNVRSIDSGSRQPASSFINVYLPNADGTKRRKVGSLPLNESRPYEAALHARLSSDPEALKTMVALLQFDFQLVETEVKDGDLPF